MKKPKPTGKPTPKPNPSMLLDSALNISEEVKRITNTRSYK